MSAIARAGAATGLPGMMLVLGLALSLVSGAALAQGDRGATIGYTCMGCHGFQGKGSGEIPRLAGVASQVTAAKLREYKSDALEGTVMNRIAKGYTDEELQAVAEFFADQ